MKKISKELLIIFSIVSLIFIPAIATYSLVSKTLNNPLNIKEDEEISNNISLLNDMENKDLSEVEKEIGIIQSSFHSKDKNLNKVNYKDLFRSSVVMGDSQTEGLIVYDILDSTSVVAKKGSNLIDAKSNISTLSNLVPTNIFTLYGMNDILIYKDDINSFIRDYTSLINEIQKTLPNANIFVNSILPVQEKVITKKPIYSKINEYNEELIKMCHKLDIEFIDTTSLLINNQEFYEGDGMHLKPDFYPIWLNILRKNL